MSNNKKATTQIMLQQPYNEEFEIFLFGEHILKLENVLHAVLTKKTSRKQTL